MTPSKECSKHSECELFTWLVPTYLNLSLAETYPWPGIENKFLEIWKREELEHDHQSPCGDMLVPDMCKNKNLCEPHVQASWCLALWFVLILPFGFFHLQATIPLGKWNDKSSIGHTGIPVRWHAAVWKFEEVCCLEFDYNKPSSTSNSSAFMVIHNKSK